MIVNLCIEIEKQTRIHEAALLCARKIPIIECEILAVLEETGNVELWDPHWMEIIVKLYIRIKIRYLCKKISQIDKNIRHSFTKRVLFGHQ